MGQWASSTCGGFEMRIAVRLIRDTRAATAIEYGLIVALIVIAMIAGLQIFASGAIGMWNSVSANVAANG
jgi:pilus assembly protein Flp/PilA